jgi:F-type H+-transporting ATPase subunit delta
MKPSRKVRRASRQLFRLCLDHGVLDESRARQVAHRIAVSRRRTSLALLSDFRRRVRLDRERHRVLVASATPLDAVLREGIAVNLARRYGAGILPSFEVDPALIGGMRIKVGSDVYDGSLRARLAALRTRL